MFGVKFRQDGWLQAATLEAFSQSQAIIEFTPDGTILTANANFLQAVGYTLGEIQGRYHSLFVDAELRNSDSYRQFWAALQRGTFQAGEFRRINRAGQEIWLQASYNPVLDRRGNTVKVVKIASDITAAKNQAADYEGQVTAIGRSQAVIEFALDGTILTANENFLKTVGYSLAEIKGKHHRMFVTPAERESSDYQKFWETLAAGEFKAGEFCRVGKGGREVWLQASYNPIMDASGRPRKVIKFASDITVDKLRNADFEGQIAAIRKSQAVIEFELDGTIITANDAFTSTVGYSLAEIRGKHHSLFVDADFRASAEYREFWDALGRGVFQGGEYRRIGKGGREIYLQATYNPILDTRGKPIKVVKFASDVTQQVLARQRSEHVRAMMESVAAGAEELSASVQEIASSMEKSRAQAGGAVERVEQASHHSARLSDAARAMGGIVEIINGITGQINLLALNATIESARAGEAGKGFSVVANEVKNLANQAKTATEQISSEIASLSAVSGEVVNALSTIRQSIDSVAEYVNSTAAAVEEQSAVANEMSSSMQRAAAEAAALGSAA